MQRMRGATPHTLNSPHIKLLNSTDRAIQHLLLVAPIYEAKKLATIYTHLINHLPCATRITLIVEKAATPMVQAWIQHVSNPDRVQILTAPEGWNLTSWARDSFLAGMDRDRRPILFVPSVFPRKDDAQVPKLLQEEIAIENITASIPFEGGNLLLTDQYLLTGIDNLHLLTGETERQRLAKFKQTFEAFDSVPRKIIVIKSPLPVPIEQSHTIQIEGETWQEIFHFRNQKGTCQPIFHIDMFLSLAGTTSAGQQIILVGDPRMAAKLLGTGLHPAAIANHFDAIAEGLSRQGFCVIRNPLPLIYMDEVEKKTRTWFYVSSNNVLVQRSETAGNIVWIPAYGHDQWPELEICDRANQEIWEDLGFEVRLIHHGQLLAENLGGLHCLTNVLERG